mmetsp:Transcript_2220/g.5942  ORF Transcript_2220/g.5942 Transcript_2220/m.5942 type:complete len:509 (-) Transcript_2220:230-1756(-)
MASANNFYGNPPTNRAAPPPPKPKTTASTTASTTARRSNASRMTSRSKPGYQSARSVPASRPSGSAGATAAASSRTSPTKTKASSSAVLSGTAKNRSFASGARKPKVPSRPVGSYYGSSTATADGESVNSGAAAAVNPYASSVPSSTPTAGTTEAVDNDFDIDNDNDAWDDWGSPEAKNPTAAAAENNPHSSWAPSAAPAPAASTSDWYASGGSTATASAAPTGYTSTGFGNQTSQQQQQQQTPMQPGTGFYPNASAHQAQQPFLSGAMDSSAQTMSASNMNTGMADANSNAASNGNFFGVFMPSTTTTTTTAQQQPGGYTDSFATIEDEAPLLEELGINIPNILLKTKAVVFPFSRFGGDQIDPVAICRDGDLPGPVALLMLLGAEMVLTGKLQFGYIYVYGLCGCVAMTLVVNLISPSEAVSFWTVASIMGYSMLPVNILALVKIFVVNLINMQTLGDILACGTVVWSTMASTRLLEQGCNLREQRYLIMYPLLLFYSAFVMMTIL